MAQATQGARPDWQSAESGGQAWSAKALENAETALLQLRSITPREIWACDAGTPGLSQPVKREYVDALTGKTLGWSYRDYEGVGVGVFASPAGAAQVWSLSTQLRIELAQHDPEVTVAPATYEGRPVQKATIRNSAGAPVYVAYVDDRYGVTLALARSAPPRPITG